MAENRVPFMYDPASVARHSPWSRFYNWSGCLNDRNISAQETDKDLQRSYRWQKHRWRLGSKIDEWNKRGSGPKTQNGERNSPSLIVWRAACSTVTMVTNPTTSTAHQLTLTHLLYWDLNFPQSTHAHQPRLGVICPSILRRRHIGEDTRDHIKYDQWPLVTLVACFASR